MSSKVADEAFLDRKRLERRIEDAMPERFRSRYAMVVYSSIPYEVAQRAGSVQDKILDELLAGSQSPEDVDLDDARRLIDRELAPLLNESGADLDF